MHAKSLPLCLTICDPWTVACQAPLSRVSILELPFPPPGDLPDPGIEAVSLKTLALADRFFTTSTTWEGPP